MAATKNERRLIKSVPFVTGTLFDWLRWLRNSMFELRLMFASSMYSNKPINNNEVTYILNAMNEINETIVMERKRKIDE